MTDKYKWIGKRVDRPDGADKVTGRAVYGADVQLPGLIHGKVLRSPHAHAKIRSICTREAEKCEGVLAVVTAADFDPLHDQFAQLGEGSVNLAHLTRNVMAREKVLYRGHAVAAVAAHRGGRRVRANPVLAVDDGRGGALGRWPGGGRARRAGRFAARVAS